jgi:rhamnosyltransferase
MNKKNPKIAVLLAAYNGLAYIEAQINSILFQVGVDVMIFLSVDRSSDGTYAWCIALAESHPNVHVLPYGERFGGAGPNFYRLLRDVDLSGFEYLSFADQDDLWNPEKLWRAHCLMTEKSSAGYSSNFTAFWPTGETRLVDKAWPQRNLDFLFESAGPGCTYVLHSNLALLLQQLVRNADDRLLRIDYHDWLTYAFARTHNFSWIIDSWSSMQYRQHAHNQIGVNSGWRSFLLRVRKILNGYGFEQSLLIADLVQASSLPIVQHGLRGGRLGYLWLAFRANQCRRKRIDQAWFFISCLLLALYKPAGRSGA